MSDDVMGNTSGASAAHRQLYHPLRGLASEGAERAVRNALEGLPGILRIEVSIGMAMAEVVFDEALVSTDEVRARLALAGRQPPKAATDAAP